MTAQTTKPALSAKVALVENSAAQRIVTAARRHFFAHGFRGVTMDDLAEELGMSKKTLYASFPSKLDLLRTVLLDKFRSVEADLDRVMSAASKDVLATLHQLLTCMAPVRSRHPPRSAGNIPGGAEPATRLDSALFWKAF